MFFIITSRAKNWMQTSFRRKPDQLFFVCVFSKEWKSRTKQSFFQFQGNYLFSFCKFLNWIWTSTWRTWCSHWLFKLKCQRVFLNWHFAAKAASVIDCYSEKSISLSNPKQKQSKGQTLRVACIFVHRHIVLKFLFFKSVKTFSLNTIFLCNEYVLGWSYWPNLKNMITQRHIDWIFLGEKFFQLVEYWSNLMNYSSDLLNIHLIWLIILQFRTIILWIRSIFTKKLLIH